MNAIKKFIVPFVLGLAVGVLAAVFLPGYVRPYIPEWALGKHVVVKGTVTAKQRKDDTLLVAVNTPEGELLATFTRKIDELNLLVHEKDELEFTLPKYAPFIEDPRIIRVIKEQQAAPGPAAEAGAPEKSAKQAVPSKEKPQPAPKTPAAAKKKQADRK
jgi:hypothetical protein